jgi:hypothetical protein
VAKDMANIEATGERQELGQVARPTKWAKDMFLLTLNGYVVRKEESTLFFFLAFFRDGGVSVCARVLGGIRI